MKKYFLRNRETDLYWTFKNDGDWADDINIAESNTVAYWQSVIDEDILSNCCLMEDRRGEVACG